MSMIGEEVLPNGTLRNRQTAEMVRATTEIQGFVFDHSRSPRTIPAGAVGMFWNKQETMWKRVHSDAVWLVTFFEHGVQTVRLADIEFVPKDEYLPEWGGLP